MRVVFMGTPEFAVPSLVALTQTTDVVGVFTRPDAISGRGKTLRACPVKIAALDAGVPVYQPISLRDESALDSLSQLQPDLIVVAAYGLILPPTILDAAPLGAVNVHASLLPRWRGAAPIQRAILAGDAETGVSIMRMEVGLDTGPYCLQTTTAIGEATAAELTGSLAALGAEALVQVLPSIADGTVLWTPQDDALATYADKVSKDDVAIDSTMSGEQALVRVRASLPAAPCRVSIAARGVTLLTARVAASATDVPAAGSVHASKAGLLLGMDDGALLVERLKPDGKGEMLAADWSHGLRDLNDAVWSALS